MNPSSDSKNLVPINVFIPHDINELFKNKALDENTNKSAILRKVLNAGLKKEYGVTVRNNQIID